MALAELFRPSEHEPLAAAEWDEARAEEAIGTIVADAEAAFDSLFSGDIGVALFLRHLLDGEHRFPALGPF